MPQPKPLSVTIRRSAERDDVTLVEGDKTTVIEMSTLSRPSRNLVRRMVVGGCERGGLVQRKSALRMGRR